MNETTILVLVAVVVILLVQYLFGSSSSGSKNNPLSSLDKEDVVRREIAVGNKGKCDGWVQPA